jgi:hypothetical protein
VFCRWILAKRIVVYVGRDLFPSEARDHCPVWERHLPISEGVKCEIVAQLGADIAERGSKDGHGNQPPVTISRGDRDAIDGVDSSDLLSFRPRRNLSF